MSSARARAEHNQRTVLEGTRVLLFLAGLPLQCRPEASQALVPAQAAAGKRRGRLPMKTEGAAAAAEADPNAPERVYSIKDPVVIGGAIMHLHYSHLGHCI